MKKWYKNAVIGAAAGFLNGMFGSGGGLAAVPLLEKLLKAEPKKAHATSVSLILPLSVLSALLYLGGGYLNFSEAIKYVPFGIIGAIVGAFLLSKIPNKLLRKIFALFLIFSAVRMAVRLWK